jgi:hypothetical protein
MAVHHRDDEQVAFLDDILNGVGEYAGQPSTDILFQDRPAFWSLADAFDCTFYALDESRTQPWLPAS